MRKLVAASFAAGILITTIALPAQAADGSVTARYGCNKATFANHTNRAVIVTYGTASSDDATQLRVAAGASRTVTSRNPHFGWTARTLGGAELAVEDWPGINLPGRCKRTSGLAGTGV